jgi:uncharacterized membrane protein
LKERLIDWLTYGVIAIMIVTTLAALVMMVHQLFTG